MHFVKINIGFEGTSMAISANLEIKSNRHKNSDTGDVRRQRNKSSTVWSTTHKKSS